MKTTGMSFAVPVKVLASVCIMLVTCFPATTIAAQNAINVTGDITLKKDTDLKNTGIHFSNGTYQDSASPWSFNSLNAGSIFYNAPGVRVGIGTTSPNQMLDVRGNLSADGVIVDPLDKNIGTFSNTLIFGNGSGEGIGSNRTASVNNQWGLDFYTSYLKRVSITQAGNVGIGTSSPGGLLDINTGVGNFQVRSDNDLTPGVNLSGGPNPGILRLRNALEIWPSNDATRSGKVDVRNTTGAATISLDGATGKVSAANMPAIKSTQTYIDARSANGIISLGDPEPTSKIVDTISVNVPSDGYLHMTATLQAHVNTLNSPSFSSNEVYFKLTETTVPNSIIEFVEQVLDVTSWRTLSGDDLDIGGTITLNWVVPTGPGTRTFATSAYAPNSNTSRAHYRSHTLSILYVPNSM